MRQEMTMATILIVEDNETNLYMVKFILENNGHEVLEARTGTEGVESAIRDRPDLVIMDIQLPDVDGLEATRRIRASEANGELPIVALTSYAMSGDRESALAAGCTGYIEKPIDPETFVAQVEQYL